MALGRDDDHHRQSGEHPDGKAIIHEHYFIQSPYHDELCWEDGQLQPKKKLARASTLTSIFSVELPGIEPDVNWLKIGSHQCKRSGVCLFDNAKLPVATWENTKPL